MRIINLTPHQVTVRTESGDRVFEPSGQVARVTVSSVQIDEIDGIPIFSQTFGEIEGLPEPQEGTIYIVSLVVRQAAQAQGRTDVVSPDTSPQGAIRNEQGQIVAVRGFVR